MNANPDSVGSDLPQPGQDDVDCLGWTGTFGADPAAATVASALALGQVGKARRFYEKNRDEIDPAIATLIEQALELEPLEGASAAARTLSPLVYPSPDRWA